MHLRDDDRSQSIQIGAVLLFGILVIILSIYQAFVVPNQNEEVEFQHNQEVQNDLVELRNAFISTVGGSSPSESVSVALGTRYPSRAIFLNPGPPSGSLRTAGTQTPAINVTIQNADADGDTGDFWNGTERSYPTGSLAYQPVYNLYNAPDTIYESSVLYNEFGGRNLTLTGQSVIDGRQINLSPLNGSLSMSQSRTTAVDVRAISSSDREAAVRNVGAGSPVTVSIPTQLSESRWEELLEEEMTDGYVESIDTEQFVIDGRELNLVHIRLEEGVTYRLRMSLVSVGTNSQRSTESAYLRTVRGNGTTVPEGSNQTLIVESRDAYNNPVSGQMIEAATERADSSVSVTAETDSAGQTELIYAPPDDIDGGTEQDFVNVSFDHAPATSGTGFEEGTPENVTFSLSIDNANGSGTSGGAPYNIEFDTTQISSEEGIITCDSDVCEYNSSYDNNSRFDLTAVTSPQVAGADVDFALNTTANGDFTSTSDEETDSSGEAIGEFDATNNGSIKAYVTSGGASDTLDISLDQVSGSAATLDSAEADSGKTDVELTFSEGVYTDSGGNNPLTASDLSYTDNNGAGASAISSVSHTAGDSTATATLDTETTAGDIGSDEIAPVSDQIYDGSGNPVSTASVTVQDTTPPSDPVSTSGSIITSSNEESYSVDVELADDHEAGTVTVQLDDGSTTVTGSTIVSAETDGDTSTDTVTVSGIDASSLADGSIEIRAKITDFGSNENPSGLTALSTVTKSTAPFQSSTATAILPQISGQNQSFTFTPGDTPIPAGTRININLDDPQGQSPLQVDYSNTNGIDASVPLSNTNSNTDGGQSFINVTVDSEISIGQQVRVWTWPVATGDSGQYDVDITREDTGETTTASFDVNRAAGGAEISNFQATNLNANTNGQTQTFEFTFDTDVPSGERVVIGLSPAEGSNDVQYQSISNVNVTTSNTDFNVDSGDAWALIQAPSGGYSAGTSVSIGINANTGSMDNAPYELGISRGDAGTTSNQVTIDQALQGEMVRTGDTVLEFDIRNDSPDQVTVTGFSVDARDVSSGITWNNAQSAEVKIGGAGEANRKDASDDLVEFDADGTLYDLTGDSSPGEGANEDINSDEVVTVDMREFSEDIGGGGSPGLQFVDSEANADVVVVLELSDGTTQQFYFEQV